MPQNVFREAWLNTILKEKDFDCQVDNIDEDKESTIADDFFEKEEEQSLIKKFSEMEIEEEDQDVQENPPSQFLSKVNQIIKVKSSHISNELLFLLENKKNN